MNSGYFKGWYFKCCTGDKTIAFIPALHNETASLQIITDDAVFQIPFDSLTYCEKPLAVRIGDCLFSQKGIRLNIPSIRGTLRFTDLSPLRYDIMGPFQFVPFMQCRHRVYSMRHRIEGKITVNGQLYNFVNGWGYMEGDFGHSFPRQYIWTQCCFEGGSLMLSVADIPLFGFHFTGVIGVLLLQGQEYRIATYLGARLKQIKNQTVTVEQGRYRFSAKLIERRAQPLRAPSMGEMTRTIRESAACKAHYRFSCNGVSLCDFISERAGFEFEYQKDVLP